MLDVLSNPLAPMAVLLFVAGLAAGFRWGSRSAEDRIGEDLDTLGRFRIGGYLFEGRCAGNADEIRDRLEDDDDDEPGEPRTVEDLLHEPVPSEDTNRQRGHAARS